MKERPILIVLIGYIIGILWGLYFSFSIAFFYILFFIIYYMTKKFKKLKAEKIFKRYKKSEEVNKYLFSVRRYFRYVKLYISSNFIFIIIFVSIFSNSYVIIKNKEREDIQGYFQKQDRVCLEGVLVSNAEEKEYYYRYKLKINLKKLRVYYFYINIPKKYKNINIEELVYGDTLIISAEFLLPEKRRNYGGFDYNEYLKQKNIIGTLNVDEILEINENSKFSVLKISKFVQEKAKKKIDEFLPQETGAIIKGLILGDISEISDEVQEDFRNSSLSHILAVSGTHMTYLMVGISIILGKIFGKRKTYIISVLVIFFYFFMIGFSGAVARAVIMGVLLLLSKILYSKNDIITSISLSCLILLIVNPFIILDLGLQLSYGGTIGIILMQKKILNFLKLVFKKSRKKFSFLYKIRVRYVLIFFEYVSVTISAQIFILPLLLYHFNVFNTYFLISNVLVNLIIEPLMICGFIFIILIFINSLLAKFIAFYIDIGVRILLVISNIGKLPFAKIYIPTLNLFIIFIYYFLLVLILFFVNNYYSKNLNYSQIRLRNIISLIKYRLMKFYKQNSKKISLIVIVFVLIFVSIYFYPQKLKIHFVDVGQGDCTFIETPGNKTILIDGGGSINSSYDVGKNILVPYLLDRGYTSVDYIFISHFDYDHVGGLISLIEELKIGNIIIGRQFENSENCEKLEDIVRNKNMKLNIVEAGQRINIDKYTYIDILWPSASNEIQENSLNNNSLICKLIYNDFSILFTGDVEEIAEREIISKYQNNLSILKSDILKVAHHGSKTSSIVEFLNIVRPQIALIGVGESNKFGHPSENVINRLKMMEVEIYRTDEDGEIDIYVARDGKIEVKD